MLDTLTDRQMLRRARRIAGKRDRLKSEDQQALDALRAIWTEGKRRGLSSTALAEASNVESPTVRWWWQQ